MKNNYVKLINKKMNNKNGFTLMEMLIVIAIIGILSTIMVTSYLKYVDKSKQVVADQQLLEVVQCFELAFIDSTLYEDTILDNFTTVKNLNIDLKTIYKAISGNVLPETSQLSIDDTNLIYKINNKTATYKYEK